MLTILVGNNTEARARKLESLLAPLQKKGADIRTFTDIDFDIETIRSLVGSASLFGGETVVAIAGALSTADARDAFETILKELIEAPNVFVVSEASLPAAFIKKAKGAEVFEFEEKKIKKAEAFNVFALTDAYCARKRSLAWALYTRALSLGLESRQLHGTISWAVKSMIIASTTPSGESGLHAFVYSKAKENAKQFEKKELAQMAIDLADMFHESYQPSQNLDVMLEMFILRSLEKKK